MTKQDIPTVGELMVDARLKLVMQNLSSVLPPPKAKETILLLTALLDRFEETLNEVNEDPVVKGTLQQPKDMR
ncbi:MAG: hypothetical protein IH831_07645, partial [Planctomycetes bacterium]|nr:hypothetical protein [Planctomycetota bacterium]